MKPKQESTLVDRIENRLLEYFADNDLKPGDSLPNVLDLARALGVSRTIVREAVLRIRTSHILSSFERAMNLNIPGHPTVRDVFEFRWALEIGLADLVFTHKTDQDIQELEEIVDTSEQLTGTVAKFNAQLEMEFHGKLYQMSCNDTLNRFQILLAALIQYSEDAQDQGWFINDFVSRPRYITHRKLVGIIRTGTPDEFTVAMRNHLQPGIEEFHRLLAFQSRSN